MICVPASRAVSSESDDEVQESLSSLKWVVYWSVMLERSISSNEMLYDELEHQKFWVPTIARDLSTNSFKPCPLHFASFDWIPSRNSS